MKKAVLATLAIISLLTLLSLARLTSANPHPLPGTPEISASYSPDLGFNSIILKISISMLQDNDRAVRQAWYSLDGQKNVSIPLTYKGTSYWGIYNFSEATGITKIPMWSSGPHTLNVTVVYDYGDFASSASKTLYIGQPEPTPTLPVLTIVSPVDQAAYNPGQVPVIYSINSNVSYSYYALDIADDMGTSGWKRFTGNITLTGLSEGPHKLVIFVSTENTSPGFAEKTVYFKVDSSIKPSDDLSSPTPSVPEFAALPVISLMLAVFSIVIIKLNRQINKD